MTPSSKDHVLKTHREEIARIIDAKAFLDEYPSQYASRQRAAADYWVEERKAAFAKADQIIAAWNRRADPLVEELRGALIQGAEWFEEYADHHQAKGALDKASRNLERANYLRRREALALPVGGNISACTDSAGDEPDGSFASDSPCKSEGGAS